MDKKDKRFLEKIRTKVARAIEDYDLLEPGDRILVALSGGKDSAVLLDALHNRQAYFDFPYSLGAAHIHLSDVGYKADQTDLQKYCDERSIPFAYITDHTPITKGNKHPCFYCAWNRRRLLFEYAVEHGYNKVAFGHNRDDAVETFLMNMIYHSEASSFPARLPMFDGKLEIIRPFITVSDTEARRYVTITGFRPAPYNCPYAAGNDREKFRALKKHLHALHPHAVANIFEAMHRIEPAYLPRRRSN